MTAQVANAIETALNPRGIAVLIEAEHMCMSMRGVQKQGASTMTSRITGCFPSLKNKRGFSQWSAWAADRSARRKLARPAPQGAGLSCAISHISGRRRIHIAFCRI